MDEDFEYGGLFLAGIWRLLERISNLRLIYVDGVKCNKHLKPRRLPLIKSGSNFDLERREHKLLVELEGTYNGVLKAKNNFQSIVCKALKKSPGCDIVKEFDRKVKSLYKGEVEEEDGIELDNTSKEHDEDDDEKHVSDSEVEEEEDGEDIQVHNTNKEGGGDNNDKEGKDEIEVSNKERDGDAIEKQKTSIVQCRRKGCEGHIFNDKGQKDDSVVNACMDENKEKFGSVFDTFNMEVISWMDEEYQSWRIGSFDMVFFPNYQSEHFYLLVVDLKMNKFFIVDNSSNGISTKDRYDEYPDVLVYFT
ncbi:hypothetical protein LXL04_002948 [Taraxacum kok-saghyz]